VIFALTADHGVAPYPEVHSGRYPNTDAKHVDLTGLVEYQVQKLPRHGVDRSAWHWDHGVLWLDRAAIRAGGLDPDSLLRAFSQSLKRVPGIARVDNMRTLAASDTTKDAVARRWLHTFPSDNLPDLVVTLTPYSVWGYSASAEHGSPYDYDAHVPIIFLGSPFRPGRYTAQVRVVDMAPTLAATLKVPPTERIDGRVLREAFRSDLVAESDGKRAAQAGSAHAGR
jgi:hypothetical protein